MAYTLQAIIVPADASERAAQRELKCVRLSAQGLWMVPLPQDQIESMGFPSHPLTGDGETIVGPELDELCRFLSQSGKAAYVEAEFFGGDGTQACALYENGLPLSEPLVDDEAINHALRWLGVKRSGEYDEFLVAGLGMHRDTEDWLQEG